LSRLLLPCSTLHLRRQDGGRRDFARTGILIRSSGFLLFATSRLTKGMRANDTQFLIFSFFLDMLMFLLFFFSFADCCSCYVFVSRFIFSTIKFMLILFPKTDISTNTARRIVTLLLSDVRRSSCCACINVHSKVLPVLSISRSI
jgi:hypothetical protein